MSEEAVKDFTALDMDAELAKGVTIVDFWADWCGPCRQMMPIYHELAEEMAGKIIFASVNCTSETSKAAKYGVRSIPAFMIFKDGQLAGSRAGAMSKDELKAFIEGAL